MLKCKLKIVFGKYLRKWKQNPTIWTKVDMNSFKKQDEYHNNDNKLLLGIFFEAQHLHFFAIEINIYIASCIHIIFVCRAKFSFSCSNAIFNSFAPLHYLVSDVFIRYIKQLHVHVRHSASCASFLVWIGVENRMRQLKVPYKTGTKEPYQFILHKIARNALYIHIHICMSTQRNSSMDEL